MNGRGYLEQGVAVEVGELELNDELGEVLGVEDELLVELEHGQRHLEHEGAVVALAEQNVQYADARLIYDVRRSVRPSTHV